MCACKIIGVCCAVQVFLRHVSPEVNELMQQGMQLMGAGGDMALAQQTFEEVIELDPKFAEVRAVVRVLHRPASSGIIYGAG